MWQGSAERSEAGVEAELPPERDSPAAQAESEPQVSHEIDATIHSHPDGLPVLLVGEEMATPLRAGTTSSNPSCSSRQSVSLPQPLSKVENPAFGAGLRGWLGDRVGRDAGMF